MCGGRNSRTAWREDTTPKGNVPMFESLGHTIHTHLHALRPTPPKPALYTPPTHPKPAPPNPVPVITLEALQIGVYFRGSYSHLVGTNASHSPTFQTDVCSILSCQAHSTQTTASNVPRVKQVHGYLTNMKEGPRRTLQ